MSPPAPLKGDVRGRGLANVRRRVSDNIEDLRVVVLGGFVMDILIRTPSLPDWGSAVQADRIAVMPGGKGLNQAIAARRLGANVSVVGAVGQDEFGSQVLRTFEEAGIDTRYVKVVKNAETPITLGFSKSGGETSFVGWKNSDKITVDRKLILEYRQAFANADILLVTLEVDAGAIAEALGLAKQADALTVLNPAPPPDRGVMAAELRLELVDILVPNEWEARELAGTRGVQRYSVSEVAKYLSEEMGVETVCITQAHEGCAVFRNHKFRSYPAYETNAEDTTGASDAFCATLAIYREIGLEFEDAIHQAQAAGSWVVTKMGASGTMPTRRELEKHRRILDSSTA